jgi:thiamine transporter
MEKMSTRMMVEAGIMIALAQILSYVKIFEAPYGGSVTAGSMVPIIIFSLRWGFKNGLLTGLAYGALQFILGPKYSYHIVSLLFDYFIAFSVLGFAGLFNNTRAGSIVGSGFGVFLRFVCHVISGVVVFGAYAPETMNPVWYSIVYNAGYLLPEMAISLFIVGILYAPLKKASPVS